jgi:archaellum component FlaC
MSIEDKKYIERLEKQLKGMKESYGRLAESYRTLEGQYESLQNTFNKLAGKRWLQLLEPGLHDESNPL